MAVLTSIGIDTVIANAKLIQEAQDNPVKVAVLPITIVHGSKNPDRYAVAEKVSTLHYVDGDADKLPKRPVPDNTAPQVIEVPLQEQEVQEAPPVPTVPKKKVN